MMNCPFCNKQIKSGEEMCPFCGRILPVDAAQSHGKAGGETATGDIMPMGMILQGKYEIQKLIHSGGMGYVYAATDTSLRRWVALKQVKEQIKSKSHLDKLEMEALSMARLIHPNIAMVLDHFTDNNYYFLVVEYVPGKTLAEIFENKGHKLSEKDVIKWMLPVCDAVNYIHTQGFIYRDVSPDNIMLTEEGNIKLIDFGTLREVSSLSGKQVGKEGKFGFTPPEQWQGNPVPQSDVFSIAATIYYLLTDYLPISDECRITGKPKPSDYAPEYPPIRTKNAQISAGLEAVLHRAMQIDINNRYSSVNELKRALSGEVKETNIYAPAWSDENRQLPVYENKPGETPVLGIDCTVFDFGKVAVGSSVSKTVTLRNFGNSVLQGEAQSSEPWITVTPGLWVVTGVIQSITITVDTSLLLLEKQMRGFINIESNGGSARIEVRVMASGKKAGRFKAWMLAPAAGLLIMLIAISNSPTCKSPMIQTDAKSTYSYSDLKLDLSKSDPSTFSIRNAGGQQLTGTVKTDKPWLHVDTDTVNLSSGKQDVTFWVDTNGMKHKATEKGTIQIKTNGGTINIPVNLSTTAVIFEDKLDGTDNDWYVNSNINGERKFTNGGYVITCNNSEYVIYGFPSDAETYDDFVVEVDVKATPSSAKYGYCGIAFRRVEDDNYQYAISNTTSKYTLVKMLDSEGVDLIKWTESAAINSGTNNNRLKVKCQGSNISLFCNDVLLSTVTDSTHKMGKLFLFAGFQKDNSSYYIVEKGEFVFNNYRISLP